MRRAWGSAMPVALVLLAVPFRGPLTRVELQSIEHGAAGSDGEPGASRSGPGGGGAPTETSMPGELVPTHFAPYTGGTMAATSSSRSSSGSQTRRTSRADVRPDADDTAHVLSRIVPCRGRTGRCAAVHPQSRRLPGSRHDEPGCGHDGLDFSEKSEPEVNRPVVRIRVL